VRALREALAAGDAGAHAAPGPGNRP
jgi:hypothetical protein